ncbi:hypothetical protein SSP531S_21730 [Streptomyces spongiicola]|uniref:Uncharacterized protein n=1 Tax=Streptomyces spongiicola TaxID=1690221 RepID=A0A2S1Z1K3_9ACTN|nr:hypothetical protein DDQ41_16665 [Streptomyces spongiicola]GBQ00753.1 hypothetical protein SSP531S_21730 [Streptomyces spongiicola]
MVEHKGRWERQGLIPASRRESDGPGEPADRSGPAARQVADRSAEPIYASLTASWYAQGRTVPGIPDREWSDLVAWSWPRW